MKTLKFLLLQIFLISSIYSYSQEIPNSGFENWQGNEIEQWGSSNYSFMGLTWDVVSKETGNVYSGLSSAKLSVVSKTIPFIGTYSIPGAITLGQFEINLLEQQLEITGGHPFNGRPSHLTGYLRYSPVNNDTCYLGWGLSKFNGSTSDTIGVGYTDTFGIINNWSYFEVPIEYENDLIPDSLNIIISCSNPLDQADHTGTQLWIDELSFKYDGVSVQGITFDNGIKIYGTGISKNLKIISENNISEKINISLISINGGTIRQWKDIYLNDGFVVNLSDLKTGAYIFTFSRNNKIIESRKIILH